MLKSNTLFFFFTFLYCNYAAANTPPEKIFPLTYAIHSVDYYTAQVEAWQAIIIDHPENSAAWLNYYYAAKNANTLNRNAVYSLPEIMEAAQRNTPNTFEAHFITYLQSSLENRNYTALLKAYDLAPERWETYPELLAYYELQNNAERRKVFAEKIHQSLHLSQGILHWNYNALQSVGNNGILLTQGENDTYPAWILQDVLAIRTDVLVLNIYMLLADQTYRNRVFAALNIPSFSIPSRINVTDQLTYIVRQLIQHANRPVYFGIASPISLRSAWKDELHLTGLAFQHNTESTDNESIIKLNYEQHFKLTELETPLAYDPSETLVNHINFNYVPSLIVLHNSYQQSEELAKAANIESLIFDIADRANKTEEINRYFDSNDGTATEVVNIRQLDRRMQTVGHRLYASAFEVSNEDYQTFLQNLLANRRFDDLAICAIEPTDWRSYLPEEYASMEDYILYEQAKPEDKNAPIVNISHAAAKLYCEWLTLAYNQSDYKRKKFTKVQFRLPTEEEWEMAAKGERALSPYPWGGPYYRNAKGCYLANFNPHPSAMKDLDHLIEENIKDLPAESPGEDGAYFPAIVSAYHPNDFGLYNMSGNAAEMIDQANISKGGGWLDHSYFMQIESRKEEAAPSPNVGFRVFMEVVF